MSKLTDLPIALNNNPVEQLTVDLPEDAMHAAVMKKLSVLNECIAVAENPVDIHVESTRITIFTKLSYGLRKAGEALAWAYYYQKTAKANRKRAEAIAALDNFSKYVERKKLEGIEVKATDKTKEYYISIDPEAQEALNCEAYWDAVVEQFSTLRYELSESIKTLRAMSYGLKDSSTMSQVATTGDN